MRNLTAFFSSGVQVKGLVVVFLVVVFLAKAHAQTPEELFTRGNEQYTKENYQEAIDTYTKVLDAGQQSASLYFNLANANYKLNRIAPSIYNYERALQLKPNSAAIKGNLKFAQKMTIDGITPLPRNVFKKWRDNTLGLLTTDGWATLAVTCILVFALSFITYNLLVETRAKRFWFTLSLLALLMGIGGLFFSFQAQSRHFKDRPAIVFSAQANIMAGPNLKSDFAFELHEGTKVFVLQEKENWKHVRLTDGKEGWVAATDIKEL